MFSLERQDEILEYIRKNRSVQVSELAARLYVSAATIRRDLKALEDLGLIKKTHGGAILHEQSSHTTSLTFRKDLNAEAKKKIAALALPLIQNCKSIFIGCGSSDIALAEICDLEYKTILTNGLITASVLAEKNNLEVILPGGTVHYLSQSVTGTQAVRQLSECFVDATVISCSGISPEGSISEMLTDMSEIKKLMLQNSNTKILLIDHTKYSKTGIYRIAHISDFDYIVTDRKPPVELFTQAEKGNCKIIYPK